MHAQTLNALYADYITKDAIMLVLDFQGTVEEKAVISQMTLSSPYPEFAVNPAIKQTLLY